MKNLSVEEKEYPKYVIFMLVTIVISMLIFSLFNLVFSMFMDSFGALIIVFILIVSYLCLHRLYFIMGISLLIFGSFVVYHLQSPTSSDIELLHIIKNKTCFSANNKYNSDEFKNYLLSDNTLRRYEINMFASYIKKCNSENSKFSQETKAKELEYKAAQIVQDLTNSHKN